MVVAAVLGSVMVAALLRFALRSNTFAGSNASTPALDAAAEPVDAYAPPGTPGASIRARPPWPMIKTLEAAATDYAPQVWNAELLFNAAVPRSGDLARGFLVCKARSLTRHDTFGGDDLHVSISFGSPWAISSDGAKDTGVAWFTAPLVSLTGGDIIHFTIEDRDELSNDLIATDSVVFSGAPIEWRNKDAELSCRVVASDTVAAHVETSRNDAAKEIATFSETTLDPHSTDWGWPDVPASRQDIANVAGFVGWDAPVVVDLLRRYEAMVRALEEKRARAFDALLPEARTETTVTGSVGNLRVTVTRVSCAGAECAADVTIANELGTPQSWKYAVQFYIADRALGPLPASPSSSVGPNIAGGETLNVKLVAGNAAGARGDHFVGVCDWHRECRVVKP